MDNIEELSFETAFRELEEIVNKLESGEMSLEQSVNLFERGRRLSTYCQTMLDKAELRVSEMVDDVTDESMNLLD